MQRWLKWAEAEFNIPYKKETWNSGIGSLFEDCDGSQICQLTEAEFREKAKPCVGDVLFFHLQELKLASQLAAVESLLHLQSMPGLSTYPSEAVAQQAAESLERLIDSELTLPTSPSCASSPVTSDSGHNPLLTPVSNASDDYILFRDPPHVPFAPMYSPYYPGLPHATVSPPPLPAYMHHEAMSKPAMLMPATHLPPHIASIPGLSQVADFTPLHRTNSTASLSNESSNSVNCRSSPSPSPCHSFCDSPNLEELKMDDQPMPSPEEPVMAEEPSAAAAIEFQGTY